MTDNLQESRVYELKRKISTIEWDLSMISDKDVFASRERQLNSLRSELNNLLKSAK